MHRWTTPGLSLALAACSSAPAEKPASAPSSMNAETPASAPYAKLLEPWEGHYGGVPPWDEVGDTSLFVPAVHAGAAQLEEDVKAIVKNPAAPSFENTIAPLEEAGQPLERVATLFFTLASSRNTPEVQEASKTIRPLVAEIQDRINFDSDLYARVKVVYDGRDALGPEERRLVEKIHDQLVRRGANLSPAEKKKLGEMNQELAKRFTDFANRVLADEDTWVVLGEDDLAGLPPALVQTYAAAAEERDLEGWVVVNTRSAVDPFLSSSTRRDLREKVWRRFVMRGDNGDEHDTNAIIREVVALRAERAKLLGYESHAHWRMADTMAKEPSAAMDLMMKVWPAAVKKVEQEVEAMERLARAEGDPIEIEPWDYRFYMEKVRKERFDLDQSEFKKYFELDNMIQASYFMAGKLYGLAFEEITGTVPTFHPDVRVFEVTRESDGRHVGLLYRDDFARQYKRSGAWMSSYRPQEKIGEPSTPIVSNNNNFTKSGEGEPVLISLNDAETLFHEFGHALHGLIDDVTYPTLSNTPRDFVEFPSQVHENWVLTREVLDRFARHYETDEKMPQALVDKMRRAATFNQGFATVEYLAAAILDMKLHTDPEGKIDPAAFEEEALRELGMPRQIVLRHRLPQFMHLFASDAYSAGYYSYLWSDVMAADAWKAFEETGDPWNPEVAKKFARLILATGDAVDRAKAYRQFRGRDPKVEALLENRGLEE